MITGIVVNAKVLRKRPPEMRSERHRWLLVDGLLNGIMCTGLARSYGTCTLQPHLRRRFHVTLIWVERALDLS